MFINLYLICEIKIEVDIISSLFALLEFHLTGTFFISPKVLVIQEDLYLSTYILHTYIPENVYMHTCI